MPRSTDNTDGLWYYFVKNCALSAFAWVMREVAWTCPFILLNVYLKQICRLEDWRDKNLEQLIIVSLLLLPNSFIATYPPVCYCTYLTEHTFLIFRAEKSTIQYCIQFVDRRLTGRPTLSQFMSLAIRRSAKVYVQRPICSPKFAKGSVGWFSWRNQLNNTFLKFAFWFRLPPWATNASNPK